MKAMILAAGIGERLYPITKNIPKCMVDIGGKPLIEHQINWLRDNGIKEIAINLYHLPEKITEFLGNGSKLGVKIRYSHEKKLMGTAGGVKRIDDFFDDLFMVYYGDEYTNLNLSELERYHKSKNAFMTLCMREKSAGSKASNIIRLNGDNQISEFVEKPSKEQTKNLNIPNMTNCGIYLCNMKILEKIPQDSFYDFGKDVLPNLVKKEKIYGFMIPEKYYWYELGKLEKYERLKPEIEKILTSQ